jgi:hypothetical protein
MDERLVAPNEEADPKGITIVNAILTTIVVLTLFASVWLARRNLRLGRGDRKGATRLAIAVVGLQVVRMFVPADLPPGLDGFWQFFLMALALGLLIGGWVFVLYLGIEPYIRKLWPTTIVSWTRFLSGNVRDPLVGRSLLFGTAAGVTLCALRYVRFAIERALGHGAQMPLGFSENALLGPAASLATLVSDLIDSLWLPLALTLLVLLVKVIVRNIRVAVIVTFFFLTGTFAVADASPVGIAAVALVFGTQLLLLTRLGLLALLAFYVCFQTLRVFPMTGDFSAWYAGSCVFGLAVPLVLAAFGFAASLGRKGLFQGDPVADLGQ